MNIKTKFDIGENIYYIARDYATYKHMVRQDTIIRISIYHGYTGALYGLADRNPYNNTEENSIFKTEAEAQSYCNKLNLEENR